MNNMEEEIKTDQELYSYFRDRNTTLCRENFSFLMQHPEVKRLLNDYLSNILLHKPDDVFKFTKDYFKFLSASGESCKFVIFVGPPCVGKTVLITKLTEEFPGVFEMPKYCRVSESETDSEKYIKLTLEEYTQTIRENNFLYFYQAKKEYFGLRKKEVEEIQSNGKIAVIEVGFDIAKKIKKNNVDANYIGILPPSMDDLRKRINEVNELQVEKVNQMLVLAEQEVKLINMHTFITFRIMNDLLDVGFNDLKNAIKSLYPHLKYSKEELEDIKSFDYSSAVSKLKENETQNNNESNNLNEFSQNENDKQTENQENQEIKEE